VCFVYGNPEVGGWAYPYVALEEANEATIHLTYKIRRLWKKLVLLQTGSQADSILGSSYARRVRGVGTADLWEGSKHGSSRHGEGDETGGVRAPVGSINSTDSVSIHTAQEVPSLKKDLSLYHIFCVVITVYFLSAG
jgi:hypothetical protein